MGEILFDWAEELQGVEHRFQRQLPQHVTAIGEIDRLPPVNLR